MKRRERRVPCHLMLAPAYNRNAGLSVVKFPCVVARLPSNTADLAGAELDSFKERFRQNTDQFAKRIPLDRCATGFAGGFDSFAFGLHATRC